MKAGDIFKLLLNILNVGLFTFYGFPNAECIILVSDFSFSPWTTCHHQTFYFPSIHVDVRMNIKYFPNLANYSSLILLLEDQRAKHVLDRTLIIKWAELSKKVPNVLSRCHTKRRTGARGRARPSFGMKPTFLKKKKRKRKRKKKFQKINFFFSKNSKKSVSYQKKGGRGPARPSFFWYDNDSGH